MIFENRYYALLILLLWLTMPARAQGCDLTTPDDYVTRGNTRFDKGDYEGAIADYTCAIEMGIGEQDIYYYNRGTAYLNLGDYAKAEMDLSAALLVNPQYSEAYNNRGNVYYEQGFYDKALVDYEQALLYPTNIPSEADIPLLNLGHIYFERGDYQTAIDYYSRAIEADPQDASNYLARGSAYQVSGDERFVADYWRWAENNKQETVARVLPLPIVNEELAYQSGIVYQFSFRASAGQRLNAVARNNSEPGVDTLLVLLGPDGQPLSGDDDGGVDLDAVLVNYELPQSGDYTLVVTHAGGGDSGSALLSVNIDGIGEEVFTIYTLAVNKQARVFTTLGDTLNLRQGPGLNFEILDKLPSGTPVTLLEGPRKSDGYSWWFIRTPQGLEGWSVERADNEQTLQPMPQVGDEALVTTGGDTLRVRDVAGLDGNIVTRLENGTIVTVIGGPQGADDFVWWQIRTATGEEGWAVERVGGEQVLIGKFDQ